MKEKIKRGRGRPRGAAEDSNNELLSIALDPELKEKFIQFADTQGGTLSAVGRKIIKEKLYSLTEKGIQERYKIPAPEVKNCDEKNKPN